MRFLNWWDKHRVLVAVFPPHSTYQLQPLDVIYFRNLAHHYSINLDKWQISTQGISHLGKRGFWSIFWPTFNTSFCEKVILWGGSEQASGHLNQMRCLIRLNCHRVLQQDLQILHDSQQQIGERLEYLYSYLFVRFGLQRRGR